jgi:UDP-glucose 4-epimerase
LKMLVTGGAGFIGSHLVSALIYQGHNVRVIDDLSSSSITNIQAFLGTPELEFVETSMLDRNVLGEGIEWCDMVFHLAAAVGVKKVIYDPVGSTLTNIDTTSLVLELCSKFDKRVLITSTSEVYGNSTELPFREDANLVIGPTKQGRWSYACTKALDEFLALAYHQQYGLPVIVVRLFNTVGPRQAGAFGMVVPRFAQQALKGLPITIFGDGSQSRCFGHVDDIIRGIMGLYDNPDAIGQVFNIGNNEEITISELAELIIEITDSSSEIDYIPNDQVYEGKFSDLQRRVPDLQKINRFIGYKPQMSLRGTIESVVDYYQNQGAEFDLN